MQALTTIMDTVTLEGNSAVHGGAIATFTTGAVLQLSNCNFVANLAVLGGGLYAQSAFLYLGNGGGCNFYDNVAVSGGAIHADVDG